MRFAPELSRSMSTKIAGGRGCGGSGSGGGEGRGGGVGGVGGGEGRGSDVGCDGGGHGEERTHALGGPSTDEDPSTRTYDASHADASSNMFNTFSMVVTELVSQPEMSALKADASRNMFAMSVTELVSQPEMSASNADAP